MTRAEGDLIGGRYRLRERLGEGGMGEVWSAKHEVTGVVVALKLMRGDLPEPADARRRFMLEARAAASLSHPHVVEVSDVFEHEDGTPVMVMPLLEGETLRMLLEREDCLSVEQTVNLLTPVLDAVAAAHDERLVHRDLKPANIFLTDDGPVVLDFGIAKALDRPEGEATQTGVRLGTPCYMAPEQAFEESDVDGKADVWALGVVLYQCLTGARPIEAESVGQFLKHLTSNGITPIETLDPDLPPHLTELIGQMLTRDRDQRPSAQRARDILAKAESPPLNAHVARDEPSSPRGVVALAAVAALGVAAWWFWPSHEPPAEAASPPVAAVTASPSASAKTTAPSPPPAVTQSAAPAAPPVTTPSGRPDTRRRHLPAGMASALPF